MNELKWSKFDKKSLPLVFKGFSASVSVGLLSISSGAQYVTVQTIF
jgi:hypothetical protein